MKKLSKCLLLIPFALSSFNVLANSDEFAQAAQSGKVPESSSTNSAATAGKNSNLSSGRGVFVNFPSGVKGGSGAGNDWRFRNSIESDLQRNFQVFIKELPKYENAFRIAESTGIDKELLEAIAMVESGMNRNPTGPLNQCKFVGNTPKHFQQGVNPTTCMGMMQIGMSALYDAHRNKMSRGTITKLDDRLDPQKSPFIAGIILNNMRSLVTDLLKRNKYVDPLGIPHGAMVNVVRSYHSGHGDVYNVLVSHKSIPPFGFQYVYKTAFYYYALGGKKNYFADLLAGKDNFLAVHKISSGTANFNVQTTGDENDTTPYVPPKRSCEMGDPLDYKGTKLPVVNTYGKRYDYEKQKQRFNRTLDLNVPVGTPILAMEDGEILGIKQDDVIGTNISVKGKHVMTYGSISRAVAKAGQMVKKGDVIAYTGEQNAYKQPLLILSYFPDPTGDLSLREDNENRDDPLATFCKNVDIPEDMLMNAGALTQIVSDVKAEQASSLSGAIETMIKNRLGNKQWLMDLAEMSEPRLYAELAYQQMISMQIANANAKITSKTASMEATSLSLLREQQELDKMNSIRQGAINRRTTIK